MTRAVPKTGQDLGQGRPAHWLSLRQVGTWTASLPYDEESLTGDSRREKSALTATFRNVRYNGNSQLLQFIYFGLVMVPMAINVIVWVRDLITNR